MAPLQVTDTIAPVNKIKISSNSVSLAGEFAVLSQLALRGFDASMTLGNTKGVDILVSEPNTGNMFRVEVKTNYKSKPSRSKLFGYHLSWIMAEKHEQVVDESLYFCFVNIENDSNNFRFFIVPNHIVSTYVEVQHQFWLNRGVGSGAEVKTTMRNFRIGLDESDASYEIDTALAKNYENRWDLLS